MSKQVNIHEAETQFLDLVARAETGEEIVIARENIPVAKLVPIMALRISRRLGEAKGLVRLAPSFDELPKGFMDSFGIPSNSEE
jgi:prevent-host-death family protein